MGDVLLVEDVRIGRHVAKKEMPDEVARDPAMRQRFLREVQVQGRLEHPSIVPVYDVEFAGGHAKSFTMKRVTGLTLRQVLRDRDSEDADAASRFTQHRLLSMFQQLCLAVDYAHQHGVVHRDLKPANVMIGDFGEVYILDWGIAKVGDAPEEAGAGVNPSPRGETTQFGQILGTAGYIAPEQIASSGTVDARADVFSLGAILFYILAGEPMLSSTETNSLERTETGDYDGRPSRRNRARDVPPELDRICVRAVARAASDRFPTARALHDALETFLAGARDSQLRRAAADEHARHASDALERPASPGSEIEVRRAVLREAGHALALDPTHEGAGRLLARVLLEPPATVIPEAEQAFASEARAVVDRAMVPTGVLVAGFVAVCIPLLYRAGMTDLGTHVRVFGPLLAVAALALATPVMPPSFFDAKLTLIALFTGIGVAMSSGLVGAFIMTPVLALAVIAIGCLFPTVARQRETMVASGALSLVLAAALEFLWPPARAYHVVDGRLVIRPHFVPFSDESTVVLLAVATVGGIGVIGAILWIATSNLFATQRALHELAWHLRQLLPESIQAAGANERNDAAS